MVFFSVFIFLYYGVDLGFSFVVVGMVFFILWLIDGIFDFIIGYLSDCIEMFWGCCKVWMFVLVFFMMFVIYKVFLLDVDVVLFMYLFFWMIVFWISWMMLIIFYYVWVVEIFDDYNERFCIMGWWIWLGVVVNVLSKLVFIFVVVWFVFLSIVFNMVYLIGVMMLFFVLIIIVLIVW